MLNQLNRFRASTWSPFVRRGHRLADQRQQLGVVVVHQRRHVAEAVVDHVRLGRELRVRAVADELRDREAALGDVLVEGAVRQRPLGRTRCMFVSRRSRSLRWRSCGISSCVIARSRLAFR